MRGDTLGGKLSIESPIGKAILVHKVGDRVFVELGDDGYYVQIMEIINTKDEESDVIRSY